MKRSQTANKLLRGVGRLLSRAAGNFDLGRLNAREELIIFATMLKKVGMPPRAPHLPPAASVPASFSASRLPALTVYRSMRKHCTATELAKEVIQVPGHENVHWSDRPAEVFGDDTKRAGGR